MGGFSRVSLVMTLVLAASSCAQGESIESPSSMGGSGGDAGSRSTAGSGGSAGATGSGGVGGSAATGGTGGGGGTFPIGGTGGTGTGGSGGGGGSGGSGGSAGTSAGGMGGSGGSMDASSTGGAGGSAGSATGGSAATGGSGGTGATGGSAGSGGTGAGASGGTSGAPGSGGSGGTGGTPPSPTFGGVYSTNGLPQCTTTSCYHPNPKTGGCACPPGFSPTGAIKTLDDRACPSNNPPFGWQATFACVASAPAGAADFGGVYHREGGTCHVANPLTGGCTCPAGASAIELLGDHACWNDTQIGVCFDAAAPRTGFAGAWQERDPTTCLIPNPATGGCSCPAGTTDVSIRVVYGPGNAGCNATGASGGHMHFCVVP